MNLPLRVLKAVHRRALRYAREAPRYLVKRAEFEAGVRLGTLKPRTKFNRILDDQARFEYAPVLKEIERYEPEVFARKIRRANIQQAFVFDTVRHFAKGRTAPKILTVGSFEDTASMSLKKAGFPIEEIDPAVNKLSLDDFFQLPTTKKGSYDVILSTSVIEHVQDDEKFVSQIADLLAPGGVAVLTCDFQEGYKVGDPLINVDFRFYTKDDLSRRLLQHAKDCELVDAPNWDCPDPDFELAGFRYTFATYVFRKRATNGHPKA